MWRLVLRMIGRIGKRAAERRQWRRDYDEASKLGYGR